MTEKRTFLGNGCSFPPELDKDGTPTRMSAYEENIRQSLWTLLSTSPGKRVHRYDYGCPVRRYVFEILGISTQTLLRDEIERAVVMFEPHVNLNRVDSEVNGVAARPAVKVLSAKSDIKISCPFGWPLSKRFN